MTKIKGEENLKAVFKNVVEDRSDELDAYSQLDEVPSFIPPVKKKRRIPSIAVAAVCVLVLSSVIGVTISNGTVDAVKDKVTNTIHKARGEEHLISDADYFIEIDDLNDKEKMDIAYDLMPDLIVEEEMFETYSFDHMKMTKEIFGSKITVYASMFYYDEEKRELLVNQIHSNQEEGYTVPGITYEERVKNGVIYIAEDVQGEKGENHLSYLEQRNYVFIGGYFDPDVAIAYVKQNVVGELIP